MKKRLGMVICALSLCVAAIAGCGAKNDAPETEAKAQSIETAQVSVESESVIEETTEDVKETKSETVESEAQETEIVVPEGAVLVEEEEDSGSIDEASMQAALADGEYIVDCDTDSSMFHLNESCEGKAVLKVTGGMMTVHITLVSKNIVNVYSGLAADAENDPTGVIDPTEDTVTYSDGFTEVVYGFDVPVPCLDSEFDVAILGKKGTWYDHQIVVSNPVLKTE